MVSKQENILQENWYVIQNNYMEEEWDRIESESSGGAGLEGFGRGGIPLPKGCQVTPLYRKIILY